MSTFFQYKFQFNFKFKIAAIAILLISVTGCSVVDSYRSPQPQARNLPKVPEIKRQKVVKPRYTQTGKVARLQKAPVTRVTSPKSNEIDAMEKAAAQDLLNKQAKESATVDIDPYAAVPENKDVKAEADAPEVIPNTASNSSPAVKSLMIGARADIALGKTSSAVSKLERGLRIESHNPELWYLLSKAHYSDSDYVQSITMAKKSIRYTSNESLIAQNWALIKKAGEKSGDATAIKEALDYIKLNP